MLRESGPSSWMVVALVLEDWEVVVPVLLEEKGREGEVVQIGPIFMILAGPVQYRSGFLTFGGAEGKASPGTILS